MNKVSRWLRDYLRVGVVAPAPAPAPALRSMVNIGQSEVSQFAYSSAPDARSTLAMYATNNWVATAIDRIASRAASAELMITSRMDSVKTYPDHPMMDLLGAYGRPNDYQDPFELFERTFFDLDLAGQAFWFLGGSPAPQEIHLLEPTQMRIETGAALGVAAYVYRVGGRDLRLTPEQVIHFKRSNPYDRYYGLSALQAARVEVSSDTSMAHWNAQFFGEDVAIPAGILVVPETVSDDEMTRISDEVNAKYGGRRRTGVVRSAPGATAYLPAGVAPRDMDFVDGRLLSRRAVYERLELPLGLMSEASTEAHARVAERQLAETIRIRHLRLLRKLNSELLPFWPAAKLRKVDFEDLSLRSVDWDRESKRLAAVSPFMRANEVREKILKLPADPYFDEREDKQNATFTGARQSAGGRDTNSVSDGGQVSNVVGRTEQPASEPAPR
jgi:HK97 family phage portal protein